MTRTTSNDSLFGTDPSGAANILDNADFEIWQRGTSFSSLANQAYCADRWMAVYSGTPTFAVTKETTVINTGLAAIKVNVTVAGSGALYLKQSIENYQDFAGKTVTFSISINCSVANKIRIRVNDGVTEDFSSYHSGSGNWEILTCTHVVSSSATNLNVAMGVIGGSDVATVMAWYADSAMLNVGLQRTSAFIPLHPQVDLARCQRYFYITPGILGSYIVTGQAFATTGAHYTVRYPVPMRATPTVTIANPTNFATSASNSALISLTNLTSAGLGADTNTFVLQSTVASGLVAGNATTLSTNNANAQISFSADI